jgi:hypothetical protein
MELTDEEIDVIMGMLDTIEYDYGLSSLELELKEKLKKEIENEDNTNV